MEAKIKKKCSRCLGTGIDTNMTPPGVCISCEGSGYYGADFVDVTELAEDVDKCKRRLKKIMDKLEISD